MKSRLLYLALGLSVVLFLATLALWVRGYFARDGIWYNTDKGRYSVHSYRGKIWFWRLTGGRVAIDGVWTTSTPLHPGFVWDSTPDSWYDRFSNNRKWGRITPEQFTTAAPATGYSAGDPNALNWHALGFRILRNNGWVPIAQLSWNYPTARSTAIFIPHWAMAVLFGAFPAMVLPGIWRRRRRLKRGLCVHCGYDLRGSPERCPECGAPKSGV